MYNISSLTSSKPCTVFLLRFPILLAICIKNYLDFQFCDLATTFCVVYLHLSVAIYLSKSLLSMSASLHFSTTCISLSPSLHRVRLPFTTPLLIIFSSQIPNQNHAYPILFLKLHRSIHSSFPHPCFTFPYKIRHCLSFCICLMV